MDTSITYIHDKPASFMSQILPFFLALSGMKNDIERKMKKQRFSQEAASIPDSLKTNFDIHVTMKYDHRVWTFKPKQNISEKVILYLHGGAYIYNILKYHWDLIEKLLYKTNATIVVPDYPLAPGANCTDVYDFIEAIYHELIIKLPAQNIIFMGDSAGGGIALGFAQELRNKNKKQPAQIILLSPWIDITMSNPAIIKAEKKDKILGIKGLQMTGQSYAGNMDTKNFKVSPIYGDFSGLGKISVFTGTHDLLFPDIIRLRNLLIKQKIPVNYFKYPKMFHAWVIFTSFRESQHAIDQIASLIRNETN